MTVIPMRPKAAVAQPVDVRFNRAAPVVPLLTPLPEPSRALVAFLVESMRAERLADAEVKLADAEVKKVVTIVRKPRPPSPYFELPYAWKEDAKQRVLRAFVDLVPGASEEDMDQPADIAISSLEGSWHCYRVGATACLFDIVGFLTRFRLPLFPDAAEAITAMAMAAVMPKGQASDGHAQALRRHRSSLVKRLRFEHVSVAYDTDRRKRRGAADPDAVTRELAAEFADAFGRGGVAGLVRMARAVASEVDRSDGAPTMRQVFGALEAHWPANRFERTTRTRAIGMARDLMPDVARASNATEEMIARNYRECAAAADDEITLLFDGNPNPGVWPGRYALPSGATCRALGWDAIHDGFSALAIGADDAYAALPILLQETSN
jgi:hypothetical protein